MGRGQKHFGGGACCCRTSLAGVPRWRASGSERKACRVLGLPDARATFAAIPGGVVRAGGYLRAARAIRTLRTLGVGSSAVGLRAGVGRYRELARGLGGCRHLRAV